MVARGQLYSGLSGHEAWQQLCSGLPGHEAWQQAPLPTEPYHWPHMATFLIPSLPSELSLQTLISYSFYTESFQRADPLGNFYIKCYKNGSGSSFLKNKNDYYILSTSSYFCKSSFHTKGE